MQRFILLCCALCYAVVFLHVTLFPCRCRCMYIYIYTYIIRTYNISIYKCIFLCTDMHVCVHIIYVKTFYTTLYYRTHNNMIYIKLCCSLLFGSCYNNFFLPRCNRCYSTVVYVKLHCINLYHAMLYGSKS